MEQLSLGKECSNPNTNEGSVNNPTSSNMTLGLTSEGLGTTWNLHFKVPYLEQPV